MRIPTACCTAALTVAVLIACAGVTPWVWARAAASEGSRSPGGSLLPGRCERLCSGVYETRAPAMIDKVGGRYALTVRCDGVHRIYVHVPSTVDLQKFVGKSVRARYRYVEEHNPHTRCVRAPCPPATERVLDVIELVEVPGSLPEGKRLPGEGPGAGSNPSSQTERRP